MSYGTNAGLDSYWAERGYVATLTDQEKNALRANASRYVDGLGWAMSGTGRRYSLFPGTPTGEDEWPREGASDYYGREIVGVPQAVLNAVYEAAWFIQGGGDVNRAVAPDQVVTRDKIDVIEISYAEGQAMGGQSDSRPMIPAVMDALAPVLSGGSNPYGITMLVQP